MTDLTAERLRALLTYDPATGTFTWLCTRPRVRPGDVAGYLHCYGYSIIMIEKKNHKAHRLAWLYMTGEWPNGQIDHINGRRADNRWTNLREATQTQNNANAKRRTDNTSGVKGVCFDVSRGNFIAYINHDGRRTYLGRFADLCPAREAYRAAAVRLFGAYARAD